VKIAITSRTLSNRVDFVKWLNEKFEEVRLNNSDKLRDESLIKFLDGCECVILGTEPFHKNIILNTDLQVVFKYGVGVDNIDFETCKEKGLPVFSKKGTNSDAVSEITVSYIIQLLRNQHLSFSSARNGGWNKQVGKELRDAKIGILGLGHIGSRVFKKLNGICPGINIVTNDKDKRLQRISAHEDIYSMFETCDLITVHIDNEDLSNTNFIDEKLISLMKDGAYLINTSRGSVVDYEAISRHLDRLGGVALDVYPEEPQIPKFLVDSEKAILSCHICGSSQTALRNGENFIKESIEDYLEGIK
jgi:D-3-phosphoglycerate dehydrogenase